MATQRFESSKLVTVSFGDVVQFATHDSLTTKTPSALAARFIIVGLIGDEQLLYAAKIMESSGSDRLSRPGTMEPPVRKTQEEPWALGRIAAAMLWQFGAETDIDRLQGMLAPAAEEPPAEFPAF